MSNQGGSRDGIRHKGAEKVWWGVGECANWGRAGLLKPQERTMGKAHK